jgi:Fe-S cluster assembly protein SufD
VSLARAAISRETVEALSHRRGEPPWLLALRLRALEAYERLPMPDQRTEGWRRTSLRGLPLDAFDPLAAADARATVRFVVASERPPARTLGGAQGPSGESALDSSRAVVLDFSEALRDARMAERLRQHLGTVVPLDFDTFAALHYAFFNIGTIVLIPRGAIVEEPIWLTYEVAEEPRGAALVHTLVLADDESDARLVEDFRGGAGLASGVVEQVLGANAHLRYVQQQRWSADVWNFSTQRARLARDASLRTMNVALGGRMARNNVQVMLDGDRAQADLLGIVAAHQRQHVDFETLQEHVGNGTRSDLVIHNALRDRASSNFTGLIRITKAAHKTESSQQQKNVLLSDHARADSDPKLEILNNDVIRCTHGASVGPVDQEMVFYLQSRGLDRPEAERLIVEGFFQSVLQKLDLPGIEPSVWSAINEHDRAHTDDVEGSRVAAAANGTRQ